MKVFLSYKHDSNAPLIEKIKEYLSKDAEGYLRHEAWIDTLEIQVGSMGVGLIPFCSET